MTVAEIQRALLARGYDLGPMGADNALGRLTIAAVTAFQKAEKLDILYPGTIGPKTIAALGLSAAGPVAPPWIAEARRYLGLHERKDAARLDKALRLDASEIPWCGAFVGMVVAATLPREVLPVNPLGARNWLKFGSEIKEPQIGAVAVFWRGTKSGWSGHVGFVVGHDKTHLHILGGNQSDSVSVARIAKDRLLGYRWPRTAPDVPIGKLALSTINASVTTNEA
ncbi:TIGR02594 family protein [Methylorubrum populi]|uniref:NlpC/P60 family protein n=1 Tax=Methylorubrum populi TaxID=223967 RepID=UPI0011539003|nr:TIGR02594 family protein [Methylorubrum populi]QDI83694.1 TIGR02594 family protein [Methylorubrum populi]